MAKPKGKSEIASQREEYLKSTVLRQLAALKTLDKSALKAKWHEYFLEDPPAYNEDLLRKRLAWRIQEMYFGGFSSSVAEKMHALEQEDPGATLTSKINEISKIPKGMLPGTRMVREWHGQRYEVVALEKGFSYNGQIFRSLSAIATAITGSKWSGKEFFGLRNKNKGIKA
jgi:hypothetical protein